MKKSVVFERIVGHEEIELLWLECLGFFNPSFSESYRLLLEEEKEEKIKNFSQAPFWERVQQAPHLISPEQRDEDNNPKIFACPRTHLDSRLQKSEWRLKMFQELGPAIPTTLLTLWSSGEKWKVCLELAEGSPFLPHKQEDPDHDTNCRCIDAFSGIENVFRR